MAAASKSTNAFYPYPIALIEANVTRAPGVQRVLPGERLRNTDYLPEAGKVPWQEGVNLRTIGLRSMASC
jgi:hypothetical protein